MTTNVTINAHCAPEKKVDVIISDGDETVEVFSLDDGESADRVVYDNRIMTVTEVER